ncbi:hypothetical protein [Massilia sp. MS-15]|uniref:hypothetical protein n=1 Tax=Massilia sp. MS-15 TaxID=2878200 RepID=UPI001CD68AD4|nr:hypothetical protein [Massilia sp. MS-15]MCA1248012.1 hypothetical protein [Massilia sp. MS-15]
MSDQEHKPAPGPQPGPVERIAAAGQRSAALRRQLDDALQELAYRQRVAALARHAPNKAVQGGYRA